MLRKIGIGCGGLFAVFIVLAAIGAMMGGGDTGGGDSATAEQVQSVPTFTSTPEPAAVAAQTEPEPPAEPTPEPDPATTPEPVATAIIAPAPTETPVAAAPTGQRWFEGGTLHRATIGEWRAASDRDRLATAADWAAITMDAETATLDSLFDLAVDIMSCVDEVAQDASNDAQPAADMGAFCAVLLGAES